MPTSVVKTIADEQDWRESKAIAAKQGKSKSWGLIMHIFKNKKQHRKGAAVLSEMPPLERIIKNRGLKKTAFLKGMRAGIKRGRVDVKIKSMKKSIERTQKEYAPIKDYLKDMAKQRERSFSQKDFNKWKKKYPEDKYPGAISALVRRTKKQRKLYQPEKTAAPLDEIVKKDPAAGMGLVITGAGLGGLAAHEGYKGLGKILAERKKSRLMLTKNVLKREAKMSGAAKILKILATRGKG